MQTVDVVVVGAGPTGENVADRAVGGGLTALVVEAERVGGECSYWACMPSKALLRPVHALRAARRVAGAREAVTGELDAAAVLARRDSFTHCLDDSGQVAWLEGAGIGLVRGHGRLVGERRVEVTAADGAVVEVEARVAVVLATGTTAAVPPVPGLREAHPWTSREATSASPRARAAGGAWAPAWWGWRWRRPGTASAPTWSSSTAASGCCRGWSPSPASCSRSSCARTASTLRSGVEVVRVEREGTGPVTAHLSDGTAVTGDELLVAAGRRPATTDLGLDVVGLEPGASVPVDDSLQVDGVPWLYAAGDVNGRVLLTHQGKYQARVCGDAIVARSRGQEPDYLAEADDAMVPQVVFTDPEVASVGLTTARPRSAGCGSAPSSTTSAPSPAGRCTPTATAAAPAWSSTRTAAWSSGRRSSARTSPTCSTAPRSRSWARCRCGGCATPCRPTRR